MAGDWIKMRNDLSTDPAVIALAAKLDIEEDTIVGKLHRLWAWADQHTEDGNAHGVTETWIDRYLGVTGFAEGMHEVGWLNCTEEGVEFPNFEVHNGKSAGRRALTARRVAKSKAKSNAASVTAPLLTALPKEEKRREEKSNNNTYTAQFLRFWDLWPRNSRRTEKGRCFKYWKRDKLEAKAEHVIAVLEALKVSDQWTKENGQFIPMPATWLNKQRWDCDVNDIATTVAAQPQETAVDRARRRGEIP